MNFDVAFTIRVQENGTLQVDGVKDEQEALTVAMRSLGELHQGEDMTVLELTPYAVSDEED
jgi:hypothetical protein